MQSGEGEGLFGRYVVVEVGEVLLELVLRVCLALSQRVDVFHIANWIEWL